MESIASIIIDPEFAALIPPSSSEERAGLESSIKAEGCRDALVIWAGKNVLLDGHNRYEICQRLSVGFRTLPMEFQSREDAAIWICDNQRNRRNLAPFQRIELEERRAEYAEKKWARENQGKRTDLLQTSVKSLEPVNVVRTVAQRSGVSTDTVTKARVITAKAPEAIKEKLRAGETTINKEYKAIIEGEKKAQSLAKVEAARLEPNGKYHVQIADPPWAYEKRAEETEHRAKLLYPPMSQIEIVAYAKEKILPFFEPDAIFWLWTTNAFIHDAYHVCSEIGFEVKTILTWAKSKMGTGDWLRGKTEHCLMAVRGRPVVTLTNQTTLLEGPLREHSRKPDEFFSLVQQLCHGRMAEHFARERREGFDSIGAEIDKFVRAA